MTKTWNRHPPGGNKTGPSNTPRIIARNAGLFFYSTSKACKNGHFSERRVSSAECITCVKQKHLTDAYRLVQERWRLHRIGTTPEVKQRLLKKQKNCFALCGNEFTSTDKKCFDHSHSTAQLRGIIHDQCNRLLGTADDSIELLFAAVLYLEKYRAS